MKKNSFLFIPLMLIGFVNVFSAQNCESNNLKINFKDVVSNDGFYYYDNQLFTGDFYSLYSTSGKNEDFNGFAEGKVLNGKREGVWQWYENNNLKRETIYKNGVRSEGFVFINGNKYTVIN
ncbi:MAG: hypothetical protein P8M12_03815 [Flavobacteriales bacterium]|jgi:antitoxin component YwqK of YwqJK toxin-antitoxin module|nr:hypothetical protein [Flavobacteriales bacterium]